ncbi:MAG: type II toxin-antitoxin system PemK/MazF family toxin [Acidobacteria bacterium]|nr:type II toxin-antitoxin system PemK/MazF family toxin [Acidobacteriota bacterium]
MALVKRFDVFLLNLDETPSDDAKNTRPCVVVSPDEMNDFIDSVIVAPVSAVNHRYPTRVLFDFLGAERAVVLDQLQTVEKRRLTKKIGELEPETRKRILDTLQELFAE